MICASPHRRTFRQREIKRKRYWNAKNFRWSSRIPMGTNVVLESGTRFLQGQLSSGPSARTHRHELPAPPRRKHCIHINGVEAPHTPHHTGTPRAVMARTPGRPGVHQVACPPGAVNTTAFPAPVSTWCRHSALFASPPTTPPPPGAVHTPSAQTRRRVGSISPPRRHCRTAKITGKKFWLSHNAECVMSYKSAHITQNI